MAVPSAQVGVSGAPPGSEAITMAAAVWALGSPGPLSAAQRAARTGRISALPPPLGARTRSWDLPMTAEQFFRQWWRTR